MNIEELVFNYLTVPGGPNLIKSATRKQILFVDSNGGGSGTSGGLTPESAFTTLDAAVANLTASQGWKIYVLPGHAENITAATSIALDVAGIEIIGIGENALMPTFSATAAAGACTISAANVTLRNLKFVANFAGGCTNAIDIAAGGDGCTLDNIVMRDTTSDKEWLVHVAVATTVDDLVIKNCDFRGIVAGSMTNSILFAGTSTNTTIQDSVIIVDSSDDTVDHLTGKATNWFMRNCTVINGDTTTALYCVRLEATSTGATVNCQFGYDKVDAEVSLGAGAWWLRNWGSNTIADGGVAEPAGSAAIP